MSGYQEFIEKFREENEMDESDISSHAFGSMVYDYQESKIQEQQQVIDKLLGAIKKIRHETCGDDMHFFAVDILDDDLVKKYIKG